MYSSLNDCTHKITRAVTAYCVLNNINTVVFGDITNIRKNFDRGNVLNQKMHSWPFKRIIDKLKYKLQKEGITLVMEKESYSSQCSPLSVGVGKDYAEKAKRVQRELLVDADDEVGTYSILRLYRKRPGKTIQMADIAIPYVYKVAV